MQYIFQEDRIYPWEFTSQEGGTLYPWRFGPISNKDLSQRDTRFVLINGMRVHSLIFESAAAGLGNYARWDCVNGWTTTLEEVRKRWPEGYHGEPNWYNKGGE